MAKLVAYPMGRFHLYHLVKALAEAERENAYAVRLEPEAIAEIDFWKAEGDRPRSFSSLNRRVNMDISVTGASDATTRYWGYVLRSTLFPEFYRAASGVICGDSALNASGTSQEDTGYCAPIAEAELEALSSGVRASPANSTILMKIDNRVVYYSITKRRFKNPIMQTKLGDLLQGVLYKVADFISKFF